MVFGAVICSPRYQWGMNGSRACALDIAMAHGSVCSSAECFMSARMIMDPSLDWYATSRLVVIRGRFSVGECVSRTDGYGGDRGVSRVLADGLDGDVGCGHAQEVPPVGPLAEVPPLLANPEEVRILRRGIHPRGHQRLIRQRARIERRLTGRCRGGRAPLHGLASRTRPPRTRCTPPRRYRPPTGSPPGCSRAHPLRRARAPIGSTASGQRLCTHIGRSPHDR